MVGDLEDIGLPQLRSVEEVLFRAGLDVSRQQKTMISKARAEYERAVVFAKAGQSGFRRRTQDIENDVPYRQTVSLLQ